MLLTIKEAATVLGCSDRAVRARITRGSLRASKKKGRWLIARDALALDADGRRNAIAKADVVRATVEAGLTRGRQIPLADLVPFRHGLAVLRALDSAALKHPDAGRAREALAWALDCVAEGHHQFHRDAKLAALRTARAAFAHALARLLIAQAPAALSEAIETEVLPPLAGLIRWAEGLTA